MAAMDDKALFIDTNVLVYANVIETPLHEQALAAINAAYQSGRTIWISRQVIREYPIFVTPPSYISTRMSECAGAFPTYAGCWGYPLTPQTWTDTQAATADGTCELIAPV